MTKRHDGHSRAHRDFCSPRGDLSAILAKLLDDPRLRVGTLNFVEPIEGDELHELVELPGATDIEWATHHRAQMLLHPSRGALLLRDCAFREREPAMLLRDRITRTHEELVQLQEKLRRRLDDDLYWRGRPIVFGLGVVVRAVCPDSAIPRSVPEELIIDATDVATLARRIERLFEFFRTPATTPVAAYGAKLVADLTDSPEWIGNFIDESTLRAIHGREDHDAPAPRAA